MSAKEWRIKNRERYLAGARAWYKKNKKRANDAQKKCNLKTRYGLTKEKLDQMIGERDGKCDICGSVCSTGQRLSIDHCHDTGAVRGLLCRRCNSGLGLFGDSADILLLAFKYLTKVSK